MNTPEFATMKGWFAGRLPEGWFEGTEVTLEDDQIVVIGELPDVAVGSEASPEERTGAALGRIARFREQTRAERIAIAQEVEERFDKHVTWGARLGETTKRFTPGGSGWRAGRGGVTAARRFRRTQGQIF